MSIVRGINTVVEVQNALAAPITITGITQATNAVATSVGHTLAVGDVVVFAVAGMVQLDGVAARVTAVAGNDFTLGGIDSTSFGVFTTGTAARVSGWDSFTTLTSVSLPNSEPSRLDATTIHDSAVQEIFGLAGAVSGSMSGFFRPTEVAAVNIRNAMRNNETRAFRMVFENGNVAVFNAEVSGGQGFDLTVNAIGTATYAMAIKKFVNFYAS